MIEFGMDRMAFWRHRRPSILTLDVEVESGIVVNAAASGFEVHRDQNVRKLIGSKESKEDPHMQASVERSNGALNTAATIPGQRDVYFMSDLLGAVNAGSTEGERILLSLGNSREAMTAFRDAAPLTGQQQRNFTDNIGFVTDPGLNRLLTQNALSPKEHRHYFGGNRRHWRR